MPAEAKKTDSAPVTPAPAKTAMELARERARPVGKFTSSWIGMAPAQVNPAAVDGEIPPIDIDDTLDVSVIVYGYSERDGDKGKFLVVLVSRATSDQLSVIVTGASVVIKKLEKVGSKSGFPVSGTFKKCAGKSFSYYDFV